MLRLSRTLALLALLTGSAALSAVGAPEYQPIHQFSGNGDGAFPGGGMVLTKRGTYIGTTLRGGIVNNATFCGGGCGTIFELEPKTGKVATIYRFKGGDDGHDPGGDLVADGNGIIYGITGFGGQHDGGTIYKIDPVSKKLTTLYAFSSNDVGTNPLPLTINKAGLLYSTTYFGGANNFGALFQFNPATKAIKVLLPLGGHNPAVVNSPMAIDKNGILYGTSEAGSGTLFKFNPVTSTLTTLHSFSTDQGGPPAGGPTIIDGRGNLFGVVAQGGKVSANCDGQGCGAVYALNPVTKKFAVLHRFTGGADGGGPGGELAVDPEGRLYGETQYGGAHNKGAVFRVETSTRRLATLYSFTGKAGGGAGQGATLSFARPGTLFGVAGGGKPNQSICESEGCGILFKLQN